MNTIAIDTETWLIAPGRLAPRLVCLSWADGTSSGLLSAQDASAALRTWLTDGFRIVGHNLAFDLGVLAQHDPKLLPVIWDGYDRGAFTDTMICEILRKIRDAHTKLDPNTGRQARYSLAELVTKYIKKEVVGKSGEDAWRFRYRELDGVALDQWPKAAKDYAINDAIYTYQVYEKQAQDSVANLEEQVRNAWALHLMGCWGLRTDPVAVLELKKKLVTKISGSIGLLKRAGIYRPNGTKNLAVVRQRVKTAYGQNTPVTPKGTISTSSAILAKSGDPVLVQLASISGDQKLLSTYIPVLEVGTERPINPRFNVLVDSGRTSCRGPNIQNQPRDGGVRECYVPRDGCVYVTADYHVAELCSLAQILLDKFDKSDMAEALQAGRELHLETAAGILNCTYEEAVSRYKEGDKAVKQARQLAKAANFGFPGGLGAERFTEYAKASFGLEITVTDAKELKKQWLDRYPEMRKYFRYIADKCEEGGGQFDVQQHRSERMRGAVGFCDGCNTYFQGLSADGAKRALYEVAKECYNVPGSPLYGARSIAFVHDEIILEAKKEIAPLAAKRLTAIMIREMAAFVPDIPIKADAALMNRWYKDAEPVYDAAGELVCWNPD